MSLCEHIRCCVPCLLFFFWCFCHKISRVVAVLLQIRDWSFTLCWVGEGYIITGMINFKFPPHLPFTQQYYEPLYPPKYWNSKHSSGLQWFLLLLSVKHEFCQANKDNTFLQQHDILNVRLTHMYKFGRSFINQVSLREGIKGVLIIVLNKTSSLKQS